MNPIQLYVMLLTIQGVFAVCPRQADAPEVEVNNLSSIQDSQFHDLKFRTSKGFPSYSLQAHDNYPRPLLSIALLNQSQQHTLKGGDLDGVYDFHRTFIIAYPGGVHAVNNQKFAMEFWNIYVKRPHTNLANNSSAVSLNVLFKASNQTHGRLAPVLSAIKELSINGLSVVLPYSYDPYALLPRHSRLIVFTTDTYPHEMKTTVETHDCLRLKVIMFPQPLEISKADLRMILRKMEKVSYSSLNNNDRFKNAFRARKQKVTAQLTGAKKTILRQRRVARAAGFLLPIRTWDDGDSQPPAYPPDCEFLNNILKTARKRTAQAASPLRLTLMVIILPVVVSFIHSWQRIDE